MNTKNSVLNRYSELSGDKLAKIVGGKKKSSGIDFKKFLKGLLTTVSA